MATIYNTSSNTLLSGTGDSDSIQNEGMRYVTMNGGAGNDTIVNFGEKNLLQGGADNDTLYNGYAYSNGTVVSWSQGGNNCTIVGGAGNDSISNEGGSNVTMNGGAGNDLIVNYGEKNLLQGGAGNDCFYTGYAFSNGTVRSWSQGGNNCTIVGGAGDDDISNFGEKNLLLGGAGNDVFYTGYGYLNGSIASRNGNDCTIVGGAGNDTIWLHTNEESKNTLIKYAEGDGNDYISGMDSNDTLRITEGNYTTTKSGSNIVVKVGSGKITIDGGANLSAVNIVGTVTGSSVNMLNTTSNTVISGSPYADKISNRGSNVSINGGAGNDILDLDPFYVGSQNNVTLTGGIGIDTFVADPYYSNTISAVITDFSSEDVFVFDSDFYNSDGEKNLTYSIVKGNVVIKNNPSGDPTFSITLQGVSNISQISSAKYYRYRYWSSGTVEEVEESSTFGQLFKSALPTGLELSGNILIATNDYFGSAINLAASEYSSVKTFDGSTLTKKIKVTGNSLANSIVGGSAADTLKGGSGNDTLKGNGGADTFIYTGGNDIIIDYVSGTDKISVRGSYTGKVSGKNVILTTSKGKLTIKNAADKTIIINGKKKKFESSDLPTGLSYSDDKTVLIVGNNFTGGTVDLSKYADVMDVDASNYRRKNLKITGNDSNNSIVGGKGSDTINGGAGDDTLTGGDGRDTFVYSKGNDYITDYTAGEDKIKLKNTTFKNVEADRNDIVITTSTGFLTLKGASGKEITLFDSSGKDISSRYSPNIAEIIADNSIGEFENYNEKISQENLITYA